MDGLHENLLKKKILIVGGDSFLGNHFYQALQANSAFDVDVTTRRTKNNKIIFFDILQPVKPSIFFVQKYDFVIWLAASKDVQWCESNRKEATRLNFQAFKESYHFFKSRSPGIRFVFISSDYVFDGKVGSYLVSDSKNPDTFYGQLKSDVEDFLKLENRNDLILRSSAVLGRGSVFLEWLLRELKEKKEVSFFENSFFTPTSVSYLSEVLIALLYGCDKNMLTKTWHICGDLRMSRYEFAKQVQEAFSSFGQAKLVRAQADTRFAKDLSMRASCDIPYRAHSFQDILNEIEKIIRKPSEIVT